MIQTSGSKDCFIRPSKIIITPAKKLSKSWFISSRRIRRSVASRPEAKSRVQSIQRAVERNDQQHGKHGVLRDLRNHSQSTVPQLCDVLDGRHWKLHLRDELATLRQNSKTKQESLWCFVDSKRRHESPYHGARHGNTQEQRNHHAAHVSNKKTKKIGYKSILDRFLNSPRYRHRMEPRTLRTLRCDCGRRSLLFATAAERFRRENTWVLVLNSSGPNGRWTNVKITTKPSTSKMKSLEKRTQDSIPVSKFDNDQVNHLPGTMKEMKESTPERDGDGTFQQPQQAHLRRVGNHLKNGGKRGVGMNSVFLLVTMSKCWAYKQWRFTCKRRGV